MHDPKRIRPFIEKIAEIWEKNPDLRFGQLILNTVNSKSLLYIIEDDKFLEMLSENVDINADYTGAYDYFTLVVECNRNHIYPEIVKDFYELLSEHGFQFISGFWDYVDESYDTIIQINQENLEKNLLGMSNDYTQRSDYMQLLFDYDGNQETRSYICNTPEDNAFSFNIIIPEHDILTHNNGKIRYITNKVNTLIDLAKKIWELPFVDAIQTYLEYSDVPKSIKELNSFLAPLSVEPFAIFPSNFDISIPSTKFEIEGVDKNGILVKTKS